MCVCMRVFVCVCLHVCVCVCVCMCVCAEITYPTIMPPNMATSKGVGPTERRAEPLGADCNNVRRSNSCNKTSKTNRDSVQYYGVCMYVCACVGGWLYCMYVCICFFKYMFVYARYIHSSVHDRNKNLYIKICLLLLTSFILIICR